MSDKPSSSGPTAPKRFAATASTPDSSPPSVEPQAKCPWGASAAQRDECSFPIPTEKLKKHPPKTATQMARLSEKRLSLLNSAPDSEKKRLATKQPKKFHLHG